MSGLFGPVFWDEISVGQSVIGGTVEASWWSHSLLVGTLLVPWVLWTTAETKRLGRCVT